MSKKTTVQNKELTTTNESSLIVPVTKAEVPQAIEILKAQLADKKGNIDEKISLDVNYSNRNIKSIDSVSELMEISASIDTRHNAYNNALIRHNLAERKIIEWKESGKNYKEWMAIIDKASHELINKSEITRLENAITKLSKHLDAETQLANELAEIMNMAQESIK